MSERLELAEMMRMRMMKPMTMTTRMARSHPHPHHLRQLQSLRHWCRAMDLWSYLYVWDRMNPCSPAMSERLELAEMMRMRMMKPMTMTTRMARRMTTMTWACFIYLEESLRIPDNYVV
jgi:hypothetical protein